MLTPARTGTDLEDVTPREVSPSQDKHCLIPLGWGPWSGQIYRDRSRTGVGGEVTEAGGPERGGGVSVSCGRSVGFTGRREFCGRTVRQQLHNITNGLNTTELYA